MKNVLWGLALVIGLGLLFSQPIVWVIGIAGVFIFWLLAQLETFIKNRKKS